ncbi:aldo/keto reductase [Sphingomonas sp. MMS24-JH45]
MPSNGSTRHAGHHHAQRRPRDAAARPAGTYQIPDAHVASVVRAGLDLGYRLIDTAAIYHNERGVGDGLDDGAWITTKLWKDGQGDPGRPRSTPAWRCWAARASTSTSSTAAPRRRPLRRGVGRHGPPAGGREGGFIGVSNFLPEHIDAIVAATGVAPAVNQIELHPGFQQREARAYHEAKGIVTQSWSPLGQGGTLKDERIVAIADRLGVSAAQVIIAWHLANGLTPIPEGGRPRSPRRQLGRTRGGAVGSGHRRDRRDGRSGRANWPEFRGILR